MYRNWEAGMSIRNYKLLLHWNQYCLRSCITSNYHIQYLGLPPFSSSLQWKLHWKFCFNMCRILKNNLTTLYAQLISDNDHKSYDVRQWVLTYPALLKLCKDELPDCKSQINQLTTKANCILTTLDQTEDTNSKYKKEV